jgi:hypothetical protein
MEKKPTFFTYNGETVIINPGSTLNNNELIERLLKMNFLSINSSYKRNDLIYIYDIALNYDNNKLKIFNKLKRDTEYSNLRRNLQKRNINEDSQNTFSNSSTKKYLIDGEIRNNRTRNNYEDEDNQDTGSSSFCGKVLSFINNHKLEILEKIFYLIIIFSFDAFIKNFTKKHFILGKIITRITSRVTPRRIVLGFLLYHIIKYILNTLFYYLFGFGFLTIMYIIFKDKIKEFLFNF